MDFTPHPTIQQETAAGAALTVERLFTSPDTHPFDTVEWELRDARIGHGDRIAFEQARRRVPQELVARTRPTSSPRSTSADSSATPSASARSSR